MSEFDDIFAYDLTTIVFTWSSIVMLIVLGLAALWPPRSTRDATTKSADRWMLVKNSSSASATRL
jgi:hypothetical protein